MKGMALITVLFILTIMTITVAWLSEEILLSLRRTENVRDSEQAWQMVTGSEAWAISVLARDSRESKSDHPAESWSNLGQGVKVEHGDLSTAIEDMQGRFNLNNLATESVAALPSAANKPEAKVWTEAFKRLLISLELNPDLSDAVLDWLDLDQNVRGSSGAEDADYLSLTPPYRAANRAFSDISELQYVKGFDQKTIAILAPFISALPATDVRININTAPAAILRILGKQLLSVDEGERLSAERPKDGYTVESFLQHDMMAGEQDIAAALIDNKSDYFLVTSSAEFGRARTKVHSLVERKDGVTTVIRRSPVL
jgi:general secretion pathway protein K